MCGSLEGAGTVSDMIDMQDTLHISGFGEEEVFAKVIPGGEHNEILWRGDFGEAYLWLFGSYASDIPENNSISSFEIYPNPVTGHLILPESLPLPCGSLKIISVAGTEVMSLPNVSSRTIDVNNLKPGIYIVFLTCEKHSFQARFVVR
jgi:alpha-glucosidase